MSQKEGGEGEGELLPQHLHCNNCGQRTIHDLKDGGCNDIRRSCAYSTAFSMRNLNMQEFVNLASF